ncbi:MAG TPA: hypothetical protein VIO16_06845 [Dehalococcoidia bacterium]
MMPLQEWLASIGDLIWVGNTLLPRSVVYWTIGIAVVLVIGVFTVLTDGADQRKK